MSRFVRQRLSTMPKTMPQRSLDVPEAAQFSDVISIDDGHHVRCHQKHTPLKIDLEAYAFLQAIDGRWSPQGPCHAFHVAPSLSRTQSSDVNDVQKWPSSDVVISNFHRDIKHHQPKKTSTTKSAVERHLRGCGFGENCAIGAVYSNSPWPRVTAPCQQ